MWQWSCQMWENNFECDKSTVKCDVEIVQWNNGTIKCEKNNAPMKCDKSSVKCDISITQCDDKTINCEKKKKIMEN